jgi:uncharacterized membrane protein
MLSTFFALFVLRWLHTLAGIVWIGILYYINFIQGPFMAEADPATKSQATQKLVPRVLLWFRHGALWTAIFGLLYLTGQAHLVGLSANEYWVKILTGATLGLVMAGNVWFVIWPAQKVVIASARQVAGGGSAIPEAAARAARGLVASRTNVLFSIPMLFFMASASHSSFGIREASVPLYGALTGILIVALEANALKGKTGPMTSVKGVIASGFALTLVFFVLLAVAAA